MEKQTKVTPQVPALHGMTPLGLPMPDSSNIRALLVDGATYDLGAAEGKYDRLSDSFSFGNGYIGRSETIYGDGADPLYAHNLRASEVARNLVGQFLPTASAKGKRLSEGETAIVLAVLRAISYRIRHSDPEMIEGEGKLTASYYIGQGIMNLQEYLTFQHPSLG